jgi:hypothetical protein
VWGVVSTQGHMSHFLHGHLSFLTYLPIGIILYIEHRLTLVHKGKKYYIFEAYLPILYNVRYCTVLWIPATTGY